MVWFDRDSLPLHLIVETAGNPDFGQSPDVEHSPRMDLGVNTLREAITIATRYRDSYDLGGGNWRRAEVLSAHTGRVVARISYNGRAWRPGPYPQPEIDPNASVEGLLALDSLLTDGEGR